MKENPPPYLCLWRFAETPPPGAQYYELRKFLEEAYKRTTIHL